MRILLVDDHTLFREALAHILGKLDADVIVIETGMTQQALDLIRQYPDLDLILWDLGLPERGGIRGLHEITIAAPTIPVIVVSASDDITDMRESLAVGAMGYIQKTATAHEMTNTIKQVLAGDVCVPPILLRKQWAEHDRSPVPHAEKERDKESLTKRQSEVLSLLALGLPNKVIAHRLNVSEGTVKLHMYAVFRALSCRNRTEAVLKAVRRGLVSSKSL